MKRLAQGLLASVATAAFFLLLPPFVSRAAAADPAASSSTLPSVGFFDSATGYAIQPAEVAVQTEGMEPGRENRAGSSPPAASSSQSQVLIRDPRYRPTSASLSRNSANPGTIRWLLDPVTIPAELDPKRIQALHRPEMTVFLGFVVDPAGKPLEHARVQAQPGGAETYTDARGYFEIYLPVTDDPDAASSQLTFTKPGYVTEARRSLEVWPNGDWTYQIQLQPGEGVVVIDENVGRRNPLGGPGADAEARRGIIPAEQEATAQNETVPGNALTNSVRAPRTIRVQLTNGLIEYVSLETYCRRSLPREWIAAWASFTGGSNALKAGAVAVRTYAIGYVNQPRDANYDICATTACQGYGTATSTFTDAAVEQTTGFVMVNTADAVPRGLTEYSSENNSLGFSCGDGFTAPTGTCLEDLVCTGEARNGHGRGMCQWGTARWATGLKFPGRSTADRVTANGFPPRDWLWILGHYYPDLHLLQALPLAANDTVKVMGTTSLAVRRCPDGSIVNGVLCPKVGDKAAGAQGTILDGPVQVTVDGRGFTWWKVRWSDGLIGWSAENYLDRGAPAPSVMAPIADQAIDEGQLLAFTVQLNTPDGLQTVANFENFAAETIGGTVMFRLPGFSGSTVDYLDSTPNLTTVTGTFPDGGTNGNRVLRVNWRFKTASNAWLRLSTFNPANLPNPVIDFTKPLRFDVYADRALRVGLGLRETDTPAGTVPGANGGTSGAVEWVGVTNGPGGQPQPVRTVEPGRWTTLVFDLPRERVLNFAGGDEVLQTASGLGVLEHLVLVPAAGPGEYNLFLDNFVVESPIHWVFSLGPGTPPGATIDPATGEFAWEPEESQGPSTQVITVRVSDSNAPLVTEARSFTVTVREVNQPPELSALADQSLYAGGTLSVFSQAVDADEPANGLLFELLDGPPDAEIDPFTGEIHWQPDPAYAGTTNTLVVRVTDDGSPPLSAEQALRVNVLARLALAASFDSNGQVTLRWQGISGTMYRVQYKNQITDPAWIDLGDPVVAADGNVRFQDTPGPNQRFYRLMIWSEEGAPAPLL